MQPHERIEHQQARLQPCNRLLQSCPIGLKIEAQTRGGDHLHVEISEADASGGGGGGGGRCAGHLLRDRATRGREAAQAGDAGGDGDGQIEGEEGFAAFGFAADDADGLFRPQFVDEPALLFGAEGRAEDRKNSRAFSR